MPPSSSSHHRTTRLARHLASLSAAGLLLAGCGAAGERASLRYGLRADEIQPRTAHPLRVAVLPLRDDRAAEDGPDSAKRFLYQGVEYESTDLDRLQGEPMAQLTEIVARHLAGARIFREVVLVLSPDQDPAADLILTGRVYRMRGYVEAEPEKKKEQPEAEAQKERRVLAEVVIKDLRLVDARQRDRVLMSVDVGWSLVERWKPGPEGPPSPWKVLEEALHVALGDLATEIAGADLSGTFIVRSKVALELPSEVEALDLGAQLFGHLPAHPPAGWAFARSSEEARPSGWKGEARCVEVRFQQQQTLRFHRVLGPYRPTVLLWACPQELALSMDMQADYPARLLGESAQHRYFAHALGETNWPAAEQEIAAHLELVLPSSKYVFEVGPNGVEAAAPPRVLQTPP